ncbi:MAG: ammonia-forming cytochrome c nitrite reductase subunit c552 [Thermodesulfobacteriota bacterium]
MAAQRKGRCFVAALGLLVWAAGPAAAAEPDVAVASCYECHDVIESLHKGAKHDGVNCTACHSGLQAHLKDPGAATRPVTDLSWYACGACHTEQLESFLTTSYHRPARDEKSQLTNRSPNPFWDKLMAGHGFTKEHALTRSHPWMVVDQFVVDRAFGGRFQPKEGWRYVAQPAGKKTWDYLEDRYPDSNEHKAFLPQTAAAANPVCFQCKSQDQILDWAYMGDPDVGAKWSRASNPVEVARTIQHGLNCFTCHDPHAAKPRVVRDGFIDALTRPEADTLWHRDPERTKIQVIDMGVRGFTRKIALLEKYDSRLQCGQCHVEYNCNPGTDAKTGERVTMADRRTNHFPYKDVLGLYDHYVGQIAFLDFKNSFTGGFLWKGQHPESETYYNSKHAKAGVQCDHCHAPKVKSAKTGKEYTSHFATTPKVMLQETCLRCHADWDEERARYTIDSVKAYFKGRMRKAEFWLDQLIDKIVEAKKAGVPEGAVKQAQDQHLKAHILWEYWTAENSDGFHNPELARESLTRSVDESQKGLKILDEALAGMAKK